MSAPRPPAGARPPAGLRAAAASAARVAAAVCLCAIVFLLLAPRSVLVFLRREYVWLGRPVDWLELLSSGTLNLSHLVVFTGLGLLARLALPRWPLRKLLACALAIGVVTELAQVWIPGRTPRLRDIVDNTAGMLLGIAIAAPVARRIRGT